MTPSEIERLAVLETKVTDIGSDVVDLKECVAALDHKVTAALAMKADWDAVIALRKEVEKKAEASDLREIRALITNVLVAVAGFGIVTIVGIVITALFGR